MPTLKIDIHIHTNHSDSNSTIGEVIEIAKGKGLDGIAITDHMKTIVPSDLAERDDGFLIIPGVEVESKDGHVLVLGVTSVPRADLSLAEVTQWAAKEGGAAVVAHPTTTGFGASEEVIRLAKPDAIETHNALVPLERYNRSSRKMAERLCLPQTGGSDSHRVNTVGDMYTVFEVKERTIAGVVQALKEGHIKPAGRRSGLTQRILSMMGI